MADGATSVAACGIGIPNIERSIRRAKKLTDPVTACCSNNLEVIGYALYFFSIYGTHGPKDLWSNVGTKT